MSRAPHPQVRTDRRFRVTVPRPLIRGPVIRCRVGTTRAIAAVAARAPRATPTVRRLYYDNSDGRVYKRDQMKNNLVTKLSRYIELDDREIAALDHLARNPHSNKAGTDLILEGTNPRNVFLLLEGWGCRYSILRNGNRQIFGYLLPGDLCDVHVFMLDKMDHSIGLLSDAKVVQIPADEMLDLLNRYPRIERALWIATLVAESTLRQWVVNVGQRNAFERVGHLFCELWVRMQAVDQVDHNKFDLPLTQTELADTLGLTSVHINRTLQRLREQGLIALGKGRLTILEPEKLVEISGFDGSYLRLEASRENTTLRSRLSLVR